MAYRGKYTPKNKSKYVGDYTKITYRSLWERNLMRWCDENPDVKQWGSEEVVIPYVCATDGKKHRYFIDFAIIFKNGNKYLVEVKPDKETKPPKPPKRKSKRYISEQLTYAKNQSKWKAANDFALDNGWKFVVWTENHLKSLGLKIL
jgi:hypothetical protein